ncbi:MFS transporter [Pollutimonas bauzanensis]|uniref:MFS transporter n=1 Tax=Pollutimonas bauzanensis TaxID=658167 RepID=UPI003340E452
MQHPASPSPLQVTAHSAIALLALLTLSRTAVAFQFQSVTSLIDTLRGTLSFSATGFGILLGIYMAPGPVMAIASPVLVRAFGAKGTVIFALLLMAAGQVGLVLAGSQEAAYLSRLVAGAGGCVVYIVTIDLAASLCDAGRMPGRMGAIAASWPLGNALSLVVLGGLISASLPDAATYLPAVFAIAAAFLIAWALRQQGLTGHKQGRQHAPRNCSRGISLQEWQYAFRITLIPGVIFALYNVSFIVFTSFTPELLQSQGYTLLAASNIASLPMWLFVVSVPLGGLLAGRSSAKDKWLVGVGCLGGGACIILSHLLQDKTVWYVLAGILGGLPTGAMLASGGRARHDLFYPTLFFIFFVLLLAFPPLVGTAIEVTGNMHSALVFCVVMLVTAFLFYIKDTSS